MNDFNICDLNLGMTSLIATPGKYRTRKDWSTNSIPQSVEEEVISSPRIIVNGNGRAVMAAASPPSSFEHNAAFGIPPKAPRRSSLALNLLTSRKTENKRRSSIAVAIFGRKDKNQNQQAASSAGAAIAVPLSNHTSEENLGKSPDSDAEIDPSLVVLNAPDGYEKEKKRRRKLERRRRKGVSVSGGGNENADIDMIGGDGFNRQKRHSWWNIFVPDNLKSR